MLLNQCDLIAACRVSSVYPVPKGSQLENTRVRGGRESWAERLGREVGHGELVPSLVRTQSALESGLVTCSSERRSAAMPSLSVTTAAMSMSVAPNPYPHAMAERAPVPINTPNNHGPATPPMAVPNE